MNPHSRSTRPQAPAIARRAGAGRAPGADDGEPTQDLPSLASILARYREHGTMAHSLAIWDPLRTQAQPVLPPSATPARARPAPAMPARASSQPGSANPRPFAEVIEGLQTRELEGGDLFEQLFGPAAPPKPGANPPSKR